MKIATLRQQIALARQQVASRSPIASSLANSESEVFKRETSDLKLRLEALGLDAASPDKALLEQRLLKAVSDLKIVEDQKDKLSDQLVRINEAILRYVKSASSVDGDARMALETEMRSSTAAARRCRRRQQPARRRRCPPARSPTPASSASRMSSPWWSRISAAARASKIGMPFQVWRDGRKIGIVRVVDVRESISGAVIQSLDPSEQSESGGHPARGCAD